MAKAYIAMQNGDKGAKEEFAKAINEAWQFNLKSDRPQSPKEFRRAVKRSLKSRIEAEKAPLQQRRSINKDVKLSEDVKRFGLPRLVGQVQDRE